MVSRIRNEINKMVASRNKKPKKTKKAKPIKEKKLPDKKQRIKEYFRRKYQEYIKQVGHQGEFGPGKRWGAK